MFQFTLPRGERQLSHTLIYTVGDVSIHAPARGATCGLQASPRCSAGFNSRSREGSDRHAKHAPTQVRTVSIHAPARGATSALRGQIEAYQFQFTLPRGERPEFISSIFSSSKFQFTLPRGERPIHILLNPLRRSFHCTPPLGERLGSNGIKIRR